MREGKIIRAEGLTRILTLDEVTNGKVRGAWGYGQILGDMINLRGFRGVPEYLFPNLVVARVGDVLGSYAEYKAKGVEYQKDPEKAPEPKS